MFKGNDSGKNHLNSINNITNDRYYEIDKAQNYKNKNIIIIQ